MFFTGGAIRSVTLLLATGIFLAATGCTRSPSAREAQYIQKGHKLVEAGDYPLAILEFKNAAQAMPRDSEPYYQLGLTYLAQKDARSAYLALTRAAELNPKHTGAGLALAKFQLASPDVSVVDEAETRVRAAMAASPNDADAFVTLAEIEIRRGKTNEAVEQMQATLSRFPQNFPAALSLVRWRVSKNDLPGAEAVLKSFVGNSPNSDEAALTLAEFYAREHRDPDAEAQAARAVQLNPKNASALLLLAKMQMASGKMDQADQTYRLIAALPDKSLRTMHADFNLQTGKNDSAIAELSNLAKQDPDDRAVRKLLIIAEMESGRARDAERLLDEALKRNPKDVPALLQRSTFLIAAGKFDNAEKDLQAVLHDSPDSADAHYALAKLAAAKESHLIERQELTEAVRLGRYLLGARLDLVALLQYKYPKAASDLLQQTPEDQQRLPAFMVAKNAVLLASGDIAGYRKALAAEPPQVQKLPAVMLQEALLKAREKDASGARVELEEVLKLEPENTAALTALAELSLSSGGMPKAVAVVEDHAASKPNSALLLTQVGVWSVRAQRLPQAREAFSKAIAANQSYLPPRIGLASVDVQEGNLNAARTGLQQVLTQQPRNNVARLHLAEVEEKAGNNQMARDYYRAILQVEPENVIALNNLAYNLASDRPDEALKYAETAVELSPDTGFAEDTLGWVYYRKGIYDKAVRYFGRALQKQPNALSRYHLALAYAKSGNGDLARQNLEAARKQDPESANARTVVKVTPNPRSLGGMCPFGLIGRVV